MLRTMPFSDIHWWALEPLCGRLACRRRLCKPLRNSCVDMTFVKQRSGGSRARTNRKDGTRCLARGAGVARDLRSLSPALCFVTSCPAADSDGDQYSLVQPAATNLQMSTASSQADLRICESKEVTNFWIDLIFTINGIDHPDWRQFSQSMGSNVWASKMDLSLQNINDGKLIAWSPQRGLG